jgi:hypothetical protein
MTLPDERWDCFISYASDDRDAVASLLANELQSKGIKVWYDQFEITPGMQLLRSINEGLANSNFGIVILSPRFFAKEWTQRELAGLYSLSIREGDRPFIIPIWYKISVDEISKQAPLMSDIISIPWDIGLENVVQKILFLIDPEKHKNPDNEYVKVIAETNKALNSDGFLGIIEKFRETFSSSSIARALEFILLNPERSREIRIRALETLYALKLINPSVVNRILTSNETDLLRDAIDLFTKKEVVLSKEQVDLLFANRNLPRHTTGLGNMVKKFIERGADYTSDVFLSGAKYPYWEVKYDCVRTVVRINDKNSLHVLASFSTMSYWKARRAIIDYIVERIKQNDLSNRDKEIAKNILSQITSDGKSDNGTPTMRHALNALKILDVN